MKEIIDPGHKYILLTLDGELNQTLTFVKRCDKIIEGRLTNKFPGNKGEYPGTTMQSVIRVILNRLRYLQNQQWSLVMADIKTNRNIYVMSCLWTCSM